MRLLESCHKNDKGQRAFQIELRITAESILKWVTTGLTETLCLWILSSVLNGVDTLTPIPRTNFSINLLGITMFQWARKCLLLIDIALINNLAQHKRLILSPSLYRFFRIYSACELHPEGAFFIIWTATDPTSYCFRESISWCRSRRCVWIIAGD